MYRRKREFRELAGWQCAAGRAILRMEASQFAPLAATTKNTILRFESGQFMPRPATVGEIDRAFRERGIYPIFTNEGEPRGIVIGWQAYIYAYPGYETQHKPVEEIAALHRKNGQPLLPAEKARAALERHRTAHDVAVAADSRKAGVAELPDGARDIARLEAEQRRLIAELERLRQEVDEDEHDF